MIILTKYSRLVGRLVYLSITCLELSYDVHALSQFLVAPQVCHWNVALRVLRYLKESSDQGIVLRPLGNMQFTDFCYSDWAAFPLTRRSVTSYLAFLGRSLIYWKTKKQPIVARSSAEAEYIVMAITTCELTK